jgi:hypothetical protein
MGLSYWLSKDSVKAKCAAARGWAIALGQKAAMPVRCMARDQRVDIVGALAGFYEFEIEHVAHHGEVVTDSIDWPKTIKSYR